MVVVHQSPPKSLSHSQIRANSHPQLVLLPTPPRNCGSWLVIYVPWFASRLQNPLVFVGWCQFSIISFDFSQVSFKCFSAFDRRSFPFSIKEWMKRVMKLVASLLLIFKCVYYSRSVVRVLSARSVNRRTVTSLSLTRRKAVRVSTPLQERKNPKPRRTPKP